MLARWLSLVALAAVLLGAAGCGSIAVSNVAEATGGQLTVYSSEPLQGPSATISEQIVNGEALALADAGGRAGLFKIGYVSLDDASPTSGQWNPGVTATNAKTAAQDPSTIAYLGDYDSAATAISLPLINAAGILQLSPASPYVGLVSSFDAGQDEPERFYPSGRRTFARLQPGDIAQADAQVQLMKSLGVHRLYVLDDQDPFEVPLADIVAGDAERAGIDGALARQPIDGRRIGVHGRGRKNRGKPDAGRVPRGRGRDGHGRAVAGPVQSRPGPAAAGVQRDGRRIVRSADRRGGGEHLPDDAGASARALPAGGPAGVERLPQGLRRRRRTPTRFTATRR